jgi:glutamate racemase
LEIQTKDLSKIGPIGVFDSGYGGLTIFKEIKKLLPQYDYIYLGDNARAPYGTRSFDTVHKYTLECVKWFFSKKCPLVILACNTASAKALRTIQQRDLKEITSSENRVLGVIRPTTENIGQHTRTNCIGILATNGTVASQSYPLEIKKFNPDVEVYQQACPMWVPLIENDAYDNAGARYFYKNDLKKLLSCSPKMDTILLGCTHYPIIMDIIREYVPSGVKILSQDFIVADSLKDYLYRHPDLESRLSKRSQIQFYTTGSVDDFDRHAPLFFDSNIESIHLDLK